MIDSSLPVRRPPLLQLKRWPHKRGDHWLEWPYKWGNYCKFVDSICTESHFKFREISIQKIHTMNI